MLGTSFFLNSFSYDFEKKKNIDIVVTSADSIVKIQIPVKEKETKPNNDIIYYWYTNNRIYSNKGGYSGKLLGGYYNVYDKEGRLVCSGTLNKGCRVGEWKYWDKSGMLTKTETWKKGLLDGWVYQYDNSGILIQKTEYDDGVKDGKEITFTSVGSTTVKYKNGKEIPAKVKEVRKPKEKAPAKVKEPKKEKVTKEPKKTETKKENSTQKKDIPPKNTEKPKKTNTEQNNKK